MMVAHSFKGEAFGPAQRLHRATYVVDATFRRADLDADNIVVDIGRASEELHAVLAELTYRNLDDESAFAGMNTSTEALAKVVADRLGQRSQAGAPGAAGIDAPPRPRCGNVYDRHVCDELASLGWSVHEHAVRGFWERPDASSFAGLADALAGIPDGSVVLIDGLIASTAH